MGLPRMGIFATKPIAADEEITFNYNFQRCGTDAQRCLCGAENCLQILGGAEKKTKEVGALPSACASFASFPTMGLCAGQSGWSLLQIRSGMELVRIVSQNTLN